jgi:hypothetical protein
MSPEANEASNEIGIANTATNFNLREEKINTRQVDAALQLLRTKRDAESLRVDETRLVRNIDWMVITLMFGVHILQFIDKSLSDFSYLLF